MFDWCLELLFYLKGAKVILAFLVEYIDYNLISIIGS